jgi:putative transcriptional regulator
MNCAGFTTPFTPFPINLCLEYGIDHEHPEDQPLNLKGTLILADPSMRDPNFFRAVLILTEHSHQVGAHGYVLNRPLGKKVSDILSTEASPGIAGVPVFIGGPVSQEQLTFAALSWNKKTRSVVFTSHLSSEDASDRLTDGAVVRAYVGYSGWGEGQLESELQQRAWITAQTKKNVLRKGKIDRLWGDILRSMGPYYKLVALTPDDPTLN